MERELTRVSKLSLACTTLLSIPGIGQLTATALVAATSGDVSHFKDARHFSSWFGLTPKEYSSGSTLYLGRISKRGDRYLRMLLTHGARSVLRAAKVADTAGRWRFKAAPITTRRRVRWPISWRAFATPRCAIRSRLEKENG